MFIYKLNKDPNVDRPPASDVWPSQTDTLETKPWPQEHFRDFDQGKPLSHFRDEDWEYYRRFYASKVEKVDRYLGQILDALGQLGRWNNTWVFFTSDHGDLCGAHRLPFKCPAMYDDLVRIPLIIVPPKGGSTGKLEKDEQTGKINDIDRLNGIREGFRWRKGDGFAGP